MRRIKKTKIIATLGPSSSSRDNIEMLIKEGAQSDFIYSSDPYLSIRIIDVSKEQQFKYEKKLYASEFCNNNFS